MAFTIPYRSFAGGEISGDLNARADQVKYQTGLATMRNFIATREGAATNRSGSGFVCPLHEFSSDTPRLIPFVFNNDQAYTLVFQDSLMTILQDGFPLFDPTTSPAAITGITNASPPVVTTGAPHGWATGDLVYASDIGGMTELRARFFSIVKLSATTFELHEGAAVDATGYGVFAVAAAAAFTRIYAVASPYDVLDLPLLRFAQSADVMTLTHPSYPVYKLSRSSSIWTFTAEDFEPDIAAPVNGVLTGTAGATTVRYQVTAVDEETLEESFPGRSARLLGSLNTVAAPWIYTYPAHGYTTGDQVLFLSTPAVAGITNTRWTITVTGANTFTCDNSVSLGLSPVAMDVVRDCITKTALVFPSAANPTLVTWTAVTGALDYNIYREVNGIYAYVGTAVTTSFQDLGYSADPLDTPPVNTPVFAEAGDYPAAVGFYQQRQVYGGSDNDPEGNRASRIGLYANFTKSNPIQADDAIRWTMATNQFNAVQHYAEMDRLFVFTKGAEWTIEGDDSGSLTPTAINARKRSENGIGDVRPLVIGQSILYVQYQGNIVNEISSGQTFGSFTTRDLTVFGSHLFYGHEITDWAHAKVPFSVVWCVRDDGALLGMTYLREQDVWGWHRHDTGDGDSYLGVACIPEGLETATYVAVSRTVNGSVRTYVERMASRLILSIDEARFLDSFITYDSEDATNTAPGDTYSLSHPTDSTWILTAAGTLTLSAADIGGLVAFHLADGTRIRARISELISTTTAYVDMAIDGLALADLVEAGDFVYPYTSATWSRGSDAITTLWHLEGREVYALCDGAVEGPFTVTDGAITLSVPASLAHVGLQIIGDLKTLEPENTNGETWSDKTKQIAEVALRVKDTIGLQVGLDEDDLQDYTTEWADPETVVDGQAYTGTLNIRNASRVTQNGHVFIRQSQPLPATVLGIYPRMDVGEV